MHLLFEHLHNSCWIILDIAFGQIKLSWKKKDKKRKILKKRLVPIMDDEYISPIRNSIEDDALITPISIFMKHRRPLRRMSTSSHYSIPHLVIRWSNVMDFCSTLSISPPQVSTLARSG